MTEDAGCDVAPQEWGHDSTKALVEQLEEVLRWQPGEDITRRYDMKKAQAALTELAARLQEREDMITGYRIQSSDQADEAIKWRRRAEAAERALTEADWEENHS